MIDYHVHTPLCNHARGTMNAFVQSAVQIGLEEICFLDHLTLQDAGRENSMTIGEVPLYFQETQILKLHYKGRIKVKSGLEIDHAPQYIDIYKEITDTFDFDIIGASIHFIDGENVVSSSSEWSRGKLDAKLYTERYADRLMEMLDHDYFDMVCHLDLLKKFSPNPLPMFDETLEPVLVKIKDKKKVVELNTGGLFQPAKEIYPSQKLLEQCAELKIPICTGSDAHAPDQVGRGFDTAASRLKAVGIDKISVFNSRRKRAIPIHI